MGKLWCLMVLYSGTPTPHLSLAIFHNCMRQRQSFFDSGKGLIYSDIKCCVSWLLLPSPILPFFVLMLWATRTQRWTREYLQLISSSTWAIRLAIHLCIFLDGLWLTLIPLNDSIFLGGIFLLLIITLKYNLFSLWIIVSTYVWLVK